MQLLLELFPNVIMAATRTVLAIVIVSVLYSGALSDNVLVNRSSFLGTVSWPTSEGLTGNFRSSYLVNDTLVFTSNAGLVVLDLDHDWSHGVIAGAYKTKSLEPISGTFNPIAPYIDEQRREIIVASGASNPRLAVLSLDTLELVSPGIEDNYTNPIAASALGEVFAVVSDGTYLYYASSGVPNIARFEIGKWDQEPQVLYLNRAPIVTLAHDKSTNFLYLGSARGNVLRVQPSANFTTSVVDILSVATDTISAIQVDYRRGFLYAATDNLKSNVTSVLFKISLASFDVVDSLPLGPLNYDIRGAAIVDTEAGGLLYLGTRQSPGRVIQVDLSRFVVETSYAVPDGTFRLDAGAYDPKRNIIWFGSFTLSNSYPTLVLIGGAESCEGDCNGQGTCSFRKCTCGTVEVNGETLKWLQPWCMYSECPTTLNCNGHGECQGDICSCTTGWTGTDCSKSLCKDPTCNNHGQCLPIGVCTCEFGWTGDSCSINPCPSNCTAASQGECNYFDGEPTGCKCVEGWTGNDCSTAASDNTVSSAIKQYTSADWSVLGAIVLASYTIFC